MEEIIKEENDEDGIIFYQRQFCKELDRRTEQGIEFSPVLNRDEENKNLDMICGNCSYYKTPYCLFAHHNDILRKKDKACSDFHFDRHLVNKKKRKQKRRLIPHGKR